MMIFMDSILVATIYNTLLLIYVILAALFAKKNKIVFSAVRILFKSSIGMLFLLLYYENIGKMLFGFMLFYVLADILAIMFQKGLVLNEIIEVNKNGNSK